MSEVNEREAIAKALYIELREGNYTYQFVLTPDTVSADKSKVYKSTICHRRVSHWSPRKNWRFTGAYNHIESYERDPMGSFVQVADKETLDKMANEVIRGFSDSFATLSRRGYVMTKLPIAVEMSEKDCKTFSEYKMSPDLYRRILRSREDLDYPAEVFDTPAPAPTTV
jgi:hypothetical protein